MRMAAGALAALAAVATACGGSTAGGGLAGGTGRSPAAGADLRGATLAAFDCRTPAEEAEQVPAAEVTAVRLCPTVSVERQAAVTVRADDPRWGRLLSALSAADVPPDPHAVCPAYADVEQRVVAAGGRGPLLVHVPVDGCRHYQRAALSVLTAIRADPHPAPSAVAAGPPCPGTDHAEIRPCALHRR